MAAVAKPIRAFIQVKNVITELDPEIHDEDAEVDLSISPLGHVGPRIVLHGPIGYYIASLADHEGELLCIDVGGRNFGLHSSVYIKFDDLKQAVETWRPGFWDECKAKRNALEHAKQREAIARTLFLEWARISWPGADDDEIVADWERRKHLSQNTDIKIIWAQADALLA
jgi:hypothetical protein